MTDLIMGGRLRDHMVVVFIITEPLLDIVAIDKS
jgi:hypothetical protein